MVLVEKIIKTPSVRVHWVQRVHTSHLLTNCRKLLACEMAGDDEELQILLSSFANQPITDDINQLLFSTQTNDNIYLQGGSVPQPQQVYTIDPAISQMLNSSTDQTEYYSGSSPSSQYSVPVTNKDVVMQLSVASPESGIGSDDAISPLGVDYGDSSSGI